MKTYTQQEDLFLEKLKITKCPWNPGKSGHPHFRHAVVASDGGSVCHSTNWPNNEYVTRLMSCSPDLFLNLFKTCMNIINLIHDHSCFDLEKNLMPIFCENEMIILKATGKSFSDLIELWSDCDR